MARKAIGKKVRFEVFKRDKFICQYCGNSAPEVTLHIDHILAVKHGGDDDILNLITSCIDCNLGKSARKLDDNTVITKQKAQLDILHDKREQLEFMAEWRAELKKVGDIEINQIVDEIEGHMNGFVVYDEYKREIKKWIKKFDSNIIFQSIQAAADQYLERRGKYVTDDSVNVYLDKIPKICYFKSLPPLEQKINWLAIVAVKKYDIEKWEVTDLLNDYAEALNSRHWGDEEIAEYFQNEVYPVLKNNRSFIDFKEQIENWANKTWND